jgi:soluble lytic murein transglycosylase-like protein
MGALFHRRVLVCILLTGGLALSVQPAQAELVFFSSGRSLSVKSHRLEGNLLVLSLRGGGEIVSDPALIVRIADDEVPYPEPATADPGGPPRSEVNDVVQLLLDPRYDALIQTAAAEQGVDARLVRAVIQVESGYQQRARSRKGAMGLMQLMPETARRYGVRNAYDPQANIQAGIRHLKQLLSQFPLALALAAYNAGEAAVERFRGIPPYPETQEYVARILRLLGS